MENDAPGRHKIHLKNRKKNFFFTFQKKNLFVPKSFLDDFFMIFSEKKKKSNYSLYIMGGNIFE